VTVAELVQALLALPQDAEVLVESGTPYPELTSRTERGAEVRPGVFDAVKRHRVYL